MVIYGWTYTIERASICRRRYDSNSATIARQLCIRLANVILQNPWAHRRLHTRLVRKHDETCTTQNEY